MTGTGGGSIWPAVADTIRRRAKGRRVGVLPTRAYSQTLEMLLGPDPRYVFVPGRSPLAPHVQFSMDDEIPFHDPDSARIVRQGHFVPIWRFRRPRGGAVLTLYERAQ